MNCIIKANHFKLQTACILEMLLLKENSDGKALMLSDVMENTHLYLSKSCRPKHFPPHLSNLKSISGSQMLFKAAHLESNADGISNFKAACFFHLKTSSRFKIQRGRILSTFTQTTSFWFDEQNVLSNKITYCNEKNGMYLRNSV